MNRKVLILGAGGFIGGHLAKRLKAAGDNVTAVDIKRHTFYAIDEIADTYIIKDLRAISNVSAILDSSFDEVYQFAAEVGGAGYIFSGQNDAAIMSNSGLININVAKVASAKRVKRLFFASSSCAFPVPDGCYGLEKAFSEAMYQAFAVASTTKFHIGRFQNVYGTHDAIATVRERFIIAVCRKIIQAEGEFIEVWGDGTQLRSFIYVDDALSAVIAQMRSDEMRPANIGNEQLIAVNEVAQALINISGRELKITNVYGNDFAQKYGYACPVGSQNKVVTNLSNKPISTKGLTHTYNWVKKQLNAD